MPDHLLESGDSPELEALFNSILSQQSVVLESGDSPALEALFNSIQSQQSVVNAAAPTPAAAQPVVLTPGSDMYHQVGQLARKLHDTLSELGYDKSLEEVAEAIPNTRDRLAYIAELTEKAAERTLNAADIAKPLQDELESQAKGLSARWEQLYANQLSSEQFAALAGETRQYLHKVPAHTQATNTQLMEIILAQDFQDLTGQVIKKIMDVVKVLEGELLTLLIQHLPSDKKAGLDPNLLNGPVVNAQGKNDVVTDQAQVDELLESLGF
ncbi:protein phosphatase CheZ [Crenobacter sp. SG2303]|uniref:Protein phosphatase CheZ n=1 Tax=Crenobacter oryzisoli TaxID=3056844 RepID=A0ABT7XNY6_9NEIS|nr:protein phosphatase CheZ [Crenobacter sp. SG2303]MDN0075509.1 protein phosphatase CheZ [Crenobacter sp. SG2303]